MLPLWPPPKMSSPLPQTDWMFLKIKSQQDKTLLFSDFPLHPEFDPSSSRMQSPLPFRSCLGHAHPGPPAIPTSWQLYSDPLLSSESLHRHSLCSGHSSLASPQDGLALILQPSPAIPLLNPFAGYTRKTASPFTRCHCQKQLFPSPSFLQPVTI